VQRCLIARQLSHEEFRVEYPMHAARCYPPGPPGEGGQVEAKSFVEEPSSPVPGTSTGLTNVAGSRS
jgi:hypothetical protein